ncbi:MAG: NAD-dependent DNA ligase LigA, partial [Muribaculaceae bacterium]|nr:NAD-dependent DNA ligase LigA [Muribaculaceae bacterium]
IHQGDMLYVEKGGEIIPKITGVDLTARVSDATPVEFVTECPVCGTPLVRDEGQAAWVCPNHYGCAPQIIGRLEHFVGRKMMDINGIGSETARQLYELGFVTDPSDIYWLTTEQLLKIEGFGPRSAQRVIEGAEESLNVPFDRVLFALSIPTVGQTMSKKIARVVRSIDHLREMSREELMAIEDVGPTVADEIIGFFADERNIRFVERLRLAGVQLELPEDDDSGRTDLLAGQSIVISGTFTRHSRD